MKRWIEILTGLAAVAFGLGAIWTGSSLWVMVIGVFVVMAVGAYLGSIARQHRLARERQGENFDDFLAALGRPDLDQGMIKTVYRVVQRQTGLGKKDIALRPTDRIDEDLGMHPDDMDWDLWGDLKKELHLVDSQAAIGRNPYCRKVVTVADLIDFCAIQERVTSP